MGSGLDGHFDYSRGQLTEAAVADNPFTQFGLWLAEAEAAPIREPNGMTLATVDRSGNPSARIVLLRGLDDRGFTFYTNYLSQKGRELTSTSRAALVIWWPELEKQVRATGAVITVSDAESDAYFARRPRGSQLGAWASPQSEEIPSRTFLEERLAEVSARFADRPVPRPPFWGGFRLEPDAVEFWQGRANRLHDRLRYEKEDGGWRVTRLAP